MRNSIFTSLLKYLLNEFNGGNHNGLEERDTFLTWPNAVTGGGIVLTIVYFFQFSFDILPWMIPVTFFLIGFSDLIDGYLAQRLDQCTRFGKFIDGLRDRLLAFVLCLNFAEIGNYSFNALLPLGVLVASEIIIATWNISLARKEKFDTHPLSKTRQLIHLVLGMSFLVQTYWGWNGITGIHFSVSLFLWLMAGASICFLFVHKRVYSV